MKPGLGRSDARCAVSWSGGKDSMLALDRALRQGLHLTHLVNLYDAGSGRVRVHGVRRELIARQALKRSGRARPVVRESGARSHRVREESELALHGVPVALSYLLGVGTDPIEQRLHTARQPLKLLATVGRDPLPIRMLPA